MNSINTSDGQCKLYVQARRTRDMYLLYLPNIGTQDRLCSRIVCIFLLYIYSVCIQKDDQPKIHKVLTATDFAVAKIYRNESSNPLQCIWNSAGDHSP